MKRFRLKYTKGKELRFTSHLDMIRLFERALRRAEIQLAYTQGFNPRQRIAYGPPLSLGHTSEAEYLDLYLDDLSQETEESLFKKLGKALPPGLQITKIKPVPTSLPALTAHIETASYQITLERAISEETPLIHPLITRRTPKHGERTFDIRPMLKWIKIKENVVETMVQTNGQGTLKPEEVIQGLGNPSKMIQIRRTGLFVNQGGKLREPLS